MQKTEKQPVTVFDTFLQSLLALSIGIFTFGQLQRISFYDSSANFYLYEIVLVLVLLLMVIKHRFKPFTLTLANKYEHSILLFILYAAATTIVSLFFYSAGDNVVALMYLARLLFYLFFIIYLMYYAFHVQFIRIVPVAIMLSIIATLAFSAIQYFWYPDLRNMFYQGWDPHAFRLFGVFLEPVIAAAVCGLFLLYLLVQKRIHKAVSVPLMLALLLCIVATFARSAYIALAFVGLVYVIRHKKVSHLLIAGVIAVIVLFMLPKPSGEGVNLARTSTVFSRAEDYDQGVEIWKQSPWLGIGYNHIRAEKETQNIDPSIPVNSAGSFHSSFLIILVTTGIFGLLLFINMLVRLAQLGEFETYAITFLSVLSVFDNVLLHPFMLFLFAVLAVTVTRLSYK